MKSILLVICLMFLAVVSNAQVWGPANKVTLSWQESATLQDGSEIPEGNVIKYQVYKKSTSAMTEEKVGDPISTLEQPIIFSVEGDYYLGVSVLRYVDGTMIAESPIAWSSVSENCKDGVAFGITYRMAVIAPKGLFLK